MYYNNTLCLQAVTKPWNGNFNMEINLNRNQNHNLVNYKLDFKYNFAVNYMHTNCYEKKNKQRYNI